jgi:hypothetical protein
MLPTACDCSNQVRAALIWGCRPRPLMPTARGVTSSGQMRSPVTHSTHCTAITELVFAAIALLRPSTCWTPRACSRARPAHRRPCSKEQSSSPREETEPLPRAELRPLGGSAGDCPMIRERTDRLLNSARELFGTLNAVLFRTLARSHGVLEVPHCLPKTPACDGKPPGIQSAAPITPVRGRFDAVSRRRAPGDARWLPTSERAPIRARAGRRRRRTGYCRSGRWRPRGEWPGR